MSKRGRGGSAGAKFRISLGLPVGAVINCADNTDEGERTCAGAVLEMRSKQQPRPSYRWLNTNENGKGGRKRRLSQTPQVVVQPKVQRPTVKLPASTIQKPQLVVKAQPQKPLKVTNIQVINPQPRVYCKPVETVAPQRKVIRVAPMAGNPRSILLPVTIKDMKDLKSIKIINASDLKNASNIKLAAANLLSQSKLQDKLDRSDYEYDNNQGECSIFC